ncbi:MAG: FAD:protein FMN transferase, partial [Eubacterium sp.]|nr:FAD:protein FMN transferase [Eubacterium sp.]
MTQNKRLVAIILVVVILVGVIFVVWSSTESSKSGESTSEFFAMDTVMKVTVYGLDNNSDLFKRMNDYVYDLEHKISVTDEDSDIYKINSSNGGEIKVSDDTYELLKK